MGVKSWAQEVVEMVEYGIAVGGPAGGGGGGFNTANFVYWAESVVTDPTALLIAGSAFALILLFIYLR